MNSGDAIRGIYMSLQWRIQASVGSPHIHTSLNKLRKRPGKIKVDPDAAKTPISIQLDGAVLADLRSEAERIGILYQTLISSILHRYIRGELVDPKAIDLSRIVAKAS